VKNTVLAKRYAKALFAVGKEDNKLDAYNEGLQALARLVGDPGILDALTNPVYPVDVRAKVMGSLAEAVKADQVMARFLDLLVEKRRAAVLADIAEVFLQMVDEDHNRCRGTMVTAIEVDGALGDQVKATLEKITGKQVELSRVVDPAIIGGMIAQVGDLVLDGSIKTQLQGLKDSIKGRA